MKRHHYDPFKKEKKSFFSKKEETPEVEEEMVQPPEEPAFENIDELHKIKERPLPRRNKYPISSVVAAGFWIRFVAFILDLIVAKAFSSLIASPIIAIAGWPSGLFPVAIKGIAFYLYFILATYCTNGQTLGKIICGLRVIHPEEERLSFTTVLVREGAARLIQTTFFILYVVTAFTDRKQNIGDLLADTYVVKEELYAMERDDETLFYNYSI